MRPIEQIQAINEQLNGPGVWETPKPKPASEHVALQPQPGDDEFWSFFFQMNRP